MKIVLSIYCFFISCNDTNNNKIVNNHGCTPSKNKLDYYKQEITPFLKILLKVKFWFWWDF